jgi:diguanylate cyclase (GGDEF)-like protein
VIAVTLLCLASTCVVAESVAFELALGRAELANVDAGEIAAGLHDAAFDVLPPGERQAGPARNHANWYRITLSEPWNDREVPLLVLYAPFANIVTVSMPPEYRPLRRTLRDPDLDPRYSRHALVFELPRELGPGQPIYLRFEAGRRFPARVAIATRAEFSAGDLDYQRRITTILTTIAIMLVVAAAFGVVLREIEFGLLAGALFCQLLYLLLLTGEAYTMPLLRELGAFGILPVWFARALGSALLLEFSVRFLALTRHTPWIAWFLRAAACVFLALIPLAFIGPLRGVVPWIGSGLVFITFLLALTAALMAWRRGSRPAGIFLLGWLPTLLLDALRELQLLGVGDAYPGNEYAQPLALAFAAVMFSTALADRMLAVRRERDDARDEARRDPLTGVLNRAAIVERLRNGIEEAWGAGHPLAVLFLDLDRFKTINDGHGHALGDACLAAVVRCVIRELRHGDAFGRYGGEEFVVVLPGASAVDARAVAERVRADVERSCREVEGKLIGLTISVGVAAYAGGMQSSADLIAEADDAMYEAKRKGRNCVFVYGRDTG